MNRYRRYITLLVAIVGVAGCTNGTEQPKAPRTALKEHPSVVLVADLREATSECGCGQIIRAVRDAAARGVKVREIDPATEPEGGKAYGILVAPTVGILDGDGTLSRQFVGEDAETLAALKQALAALKAPSPKG